MLVIVASRYDKEAQDWVKRSPDRDIRLLTCGDLSLSGWRHHPTRPQDSMAVISGKRVSIPQIDGVLNRLPGVILSEIPQISPGDRPYVAAEMTAFLSAWLQSLPCPVLNRPTATNLLGPSWRSQQWIQTAARLGIPVRPMSQAIQFASSAIGEPQETLAVTVIGNQVFGVAEPRLGQQALALARAAQVEVLTVKFYRLDRAFAGAAMWVDLAQGGIAEAIWEYVNATASAKAS